ncbi:hypothetical protein VKT23_000251 [Stygiomarasmius scandens]|uniref:Ser-Thr-rich glycosyl-phosphatidyl-inositol-anchored membrane family-domain-containing protein n=1 Tax=Marasmiellus scandens TaxID=2682957 RepID=A0ABR1K686_9AGAR
MFPQLAVLSFFASSAFATVFITSPTATTTFNGGQSAKVSWMDDGASPNLAQFGDAKVSIFTGNAIQQTFLQEISSNVNVATTSSVEFTPNPSIGPNGNEYFIRVESINLKDPKNPQFPALAFSAKFTMASMTGNFNSTVQAQIDGQSTAPIGGSTTSRSSSTSTSASTTSGSSTTSATTTTSQSQSSSATSSSESVTQENAAAATSGSADNNGAIEAKKSWMVVLAGMLVGSFVL